MTEAEEFERCMHQKDDFDAYCYRKKDHEGMHMHKPWFWFRTKGLV